MSRRAGSNSTVASSVARLTVACTPSSAFSPRSTRRGAAGARHPLDLEADVRAFVGDEVVTLLIIPRGGISVARAATSRRGAAHAREARDDSGYHRLGDREEAVREPRHGHLALVPARPRSRSPVATAGASMTNRRSSALLQHGLLREALRLDEARHDRVHAHAAAVQRAPRSSGRTRAARASPRCTRPPARTRRCRRPRRR